MRENLKETIVFDYLEKRIWRDTIETNRNDEMSREKKPCNF